MGAFPKSFSNAPRVCTSVLFIGLTFNVLCMVQRCKCRSLCSLASYGVTSGCSPDGHLWEEEPLDREALEARVVQDHGPQVPIPRHPHLQPEFVKRHFWQANARVAHTFSDDCEILSCVYMHTHFESLKRHFESLKSLW